MQSLVGKLLAFCNHSHRPVVGAVAAPWNGTVMYLGMGWATRHASKKAAAPGEEASNIFEARTGLIFLLGSLCLAVPAAAIVASYL